MNVILRRSFAESYAGPPDVSCQWYDVHDRVTGGYVPGWSVLQVDGGLVVASHPERGMWTARNLDEAAERIHAIRAGE